VNSSATYVVDASVAAKWYIPEEHEAIAQRLLEGGRDGNWVLLAPSLLLVELGNALWVHVRRHDLPADETLQIMEEAPRLPCIWYPSEVLIAAATHIAVQFGATVYDSMYLALAELTDALLITADVKLQRIIPADWHRERMLLLKELPNKLADDDRPDNDSPGRCL